MRLLLFLLLTFAASSPAWGQHDARAIEPHSEAQRADHRKLMRTYLDTFRILGRSKICGLNFDPEPFFQELARRHGENSEEARIAALAYTAGAENLMLSHEIDPTPAAPMPCDVMVYMRGMRLPDPPPPLSPKGRAG